MNGLAPYSSLKRMSVAHGHCLHKWYTRYNQASTANQAKFTWCMLQKRAHSLYCLNLQKNEIVALSWSYLQSQNYIKIWISLLTERSGDTRESLRCSKRNTVKYFVDCKSKQVSIMVQVQVGKQRIELGAASIWCWRCVQSTCLHHLTRFWTSG